MKLEDQVARQMRGAKRNVGQFLKDHFQFLFWAAHGRHLGRPMKLEDQVAPLALAQRMKEMGFPQDTQFEWWEEGSRSWVEAQQNWADRAEHIAAPTVAEMGEWLMTCNRETASRRQGNRCEAIIALLEPQGSGKHEAEARASLLIALAESGAINPKALT